MAKSEKIVYPSEGFNSYPYYDPQRPPNVLKVRQLTDYKNKVLAGAKELYETKEFTDFVIVTKNGEIPCHSNILSAQCPVIKAMLELDMTESQQKKVTIDYFPAEVVEKVVEYIYCGNVIVPPELMEDILFAADYLQVEKLTNKLMEACEKKYGFFRAENILRFRDIAEHIKHEDLAMTVKRKLVGIFHGLMQTESFLSLDPVEVGRLIKELVVDRVYTDHLVDGVLRWMKNSTNEDAFDWLNDEEFDFLVSLVLDQWVIAPADSSEAVKARVYLTVWEKDGQWLVNEYDSFVSRGYLSPIERAKIKAQRAKQVQAAMSNEKSKYSELHLYETFEQKLKAHLAEVGGEKNMESSETPDADRPKDDDKQPSDGAKLPDASKADVAMDTNDKNISTPTTEDAKKPGDAGQMDTAENDEDSNEEAVKYVDEEFDRLLSSRRFRRAIGIKLFDLVDKTKCSRSYMRLVKEILNGKMERANSLPGGSSHLCDLPKGVKDSLLEAYKDVEKLDRHEQYEPNHPKRLVVTGGSKVITVDDGTRTRDDDFKEVFATYDDAKFEELTRLPDFFHPRYSGFCEIPQGFLGAGGGESDVCYGYHASVRQFVEHKRLIIRKEKQAMAFVNNRVYLIGGYHHRQWYMQVEFMDFRDMKWYFGPDVPEPFEEPYAVGLGTSVYVMHAFRKLAVLDVVGFKWVDLAPLPEGAPEARITTDGKRLYVAGGKERVCFAYTPEDDKWETLSQPIEVHSCGALCFYKGRLLLLGGEDSDVIEEYNIEKNEWSIKKLKLPYKLSRHWAFLVEAKDPHAAVQHRDVGNDAHVPWPYPSWD